MIDHAKDEWIVEDRMLGRAISVYNEGFRTSWYINNNDFCLLLQQAAKEWSEREKLW